MKRKMAPALLVAVVCAVCSPLVEAGKFFVGGSIGAGFGDVRFADLSGVIGYLINPRWSTGARLSWRNREDTRFDPSITTNDYGASVFGRFRVAGPGYLQAEVEYLSFERILFSQDTNREGYDSLLFGGGIAPKISPSATFYVGIMYNLTYDSSDVRGPYQSPWIFRSGVGFTF